MQSYHVPAQSAEARLVEKKSEFIAQLAAVESEAEALAFLETMRTRHRTASHNVYAYVLHQDARARYSDDGEPAKTAGLPVLEAIRHAGLFNCAIVVTRYYGGVKLGTGGLVRAYTAAAAAAIQAAGAATVRTVRRLSLTLPYPLYEPATRLLEQQNARLEREPAFTDSVHADYLIPAEDAPGLLESLRELLRGQSGASLSAPFEKNW